MGAHFAPSVANLFLTHWESDVVFRDTLKELNSYYIFIDDLFMRGDEVSLLSFVDRLNQNKKNIKLTWQYNKQKMVFLDVEIYIQEGEILTITVSLQTEMAI